MFPSLSHNRVMCYQPTDKILMMENIEKFQNLWMKIHEIQCNFFLDSLPRTVGACPMYSMKPRPFAEVLVWSKAVYGPKHRVQIESHSNR